MRSSVTVQSLWSLIAARTLARKTWPAFGFGFVERFRGGEGDAELVELEREGGVDDGVVFGRG